MAVSNSISTSLDQNLSELMRLSSKSGRGEGYTEAINLGKKQILSLGETMAKLKTALTNLSKIDTELAWSTSDRPVQASSQPLGLSYDPDTPGEDDPSKLLSSVAAFSTVTAGEITVNGKTIAIDPASDTLNSVVAKINASGAGVTASISSSKDGLTLRSKLAHRAVSISEGSTGFFTAAKMTKRQYSPERISSNEFSDKRLLQKSLEEVTASFQELLDGSYYLLDSDELNNLKTGLKDAAKTFFTENGGKMVGNLGRTGVGLTFNFAFDAEKFITFDTKEFNRATEKDFLKTRNMLLGGAVSDEDQALGLKDYGFAPFMLSKVKSTFDKMVETIGTKFAQGVIVDLRA